MTQPTGLFPGEDVIIQRLKKTDNGAPSVNFQRIDLAQIVQNNAGGQPSQGNPGNENYTTDSVSFQPVDSNHTYPLTIGTSRVFYIHINS